MHQPEALSLSPTVEYCLAQLRTGKTISFSSLFFPQRNPHGVLPRVGTVAELKTIITDEHRQLAKDICVQIFVRWYEVSTIQMRPMCIKAIMALAKDPLLSVSESISLQVAIFQTLEQNYNAKKDKQMLLQLAQDFPHLAKQYTTIVEENKKSAFEILQQGGSYGKDETIRVAADQIILELESRRHTPIEDLKKYLYVLEQVDCDFVKRQEVAVRLVSEYFRDKYIGIKYMHKATKEKYSWHELIETYQITVDMLIPFLIPRGTENLIGKVSILLNSFSADERVNSISGRAYLYQLFQDYYDIGRYSVCKSIYNIIDLERFYPDIADKKEFIFSPSESKSAGNGGGKDKHIRRITEMMEKDDRQGALRFVRTFAHTKAYYLEVTYTAILKHIGTAFGAFEKLEKVLQEIEQDQFTHRDACRKQIAQNIVESFLCFAYTDDRAYDSRVQEYIEKYGVAEKILEKILTDQIAGIEEEYKKESSYPEKVFAYIRTFPVLSEQEKIEVQARLLFKKHIREFSVHRFLEQSVEIKTFQQRVLQISPKGISREIWEKSIGNLPYPNDECRFIFEHLYEAKKTTRKKHLQELVDELIANSSYKNAVFLLNRFGTEYALDLQKRFKKVYEDALQKEDLTYAEEFLETYGNYIPQASAYDIRQARLLQTLRQEPIEKIIKDHELLNQIATAGKEVLDTFGVYIGSLDTNTKEKQAVLVNIALRGTSDEDDTLFPLPIREKVAEKMLEYFKGKRSLSADEKESYYELAVHYAPNSAYYVGAAEGRFNKLYRVDRDYIACRELSEKVLRLFFQSSFDQSVTSSNEVVSRKQRLCQATAKYVQQQVSRIQNALQHLRKLDKNLHIDETHSIPLDQVPDLLQGLYDLCEEHELAQNYKREVLSIWKEYYILTGNMAALAALVKKYGLKTTALTQQTKQHLEEFLQDQNNPLVQQLTGLIKMFGMENAVDILFQLYPQYESLGATVIKSMLSRYLGEVLLSRSGMVFVSIPEQLNIKSKNFTSNLMTVVEKDFIRYYTETKKRTHAHDSQICEEYLLHLEEKFTEIHLDAEVLHDILTQLRVFFEMILAIKKPADFVEQLQAGRAFPDFLQQLNAAEIKQKKRFLIADGMGMGKSLSAILAQENIDSNTCLVVTPSNVENTWGTYLSDIQDDQQNKHGYFAPGKAPKTLIVESVQDLQRTDLNSYRYLIISQEKLSNDAYVDALMNLNYQSMIVDEVHKLKNLTQGKRANGLLELVDKIERVDGYLALLSGTPVPNKIQDVAMLLKLLYPQEYGNVDNFSLVNAIIDGDTLNLRSLLLPRMQMKKLVDHIDMPDLNEVFKHTVLSEKEQFYYDAILADDQLSASAKIMKLRQFLLNPHLLGITDIQRSSKEIAIGSDLNVLFRTKRKVVIFVNGFVNGVLRATDEITEDQTFIAQLGLDPDIQLRVIDGTNPEERQHIQDEFTSSTKKIALFVSGGTADVGIDLTAGTHIVHINEPWTQADKDQQDARVFRYGQHENIESTTYITQGSIEQGIHDYILLKHDAIMKLYYGIELSDLEKRILIADVAQVAGGSTKKEINKGLTTYFKESARELNEMYGYLRQAGSEALEELVQTHGEKFAGYYRALGPRSYQANVNRRHATLVPMLLQELEVTDPCIVDIGSGPKMLWQHISEKLQPYVTSVDINPHHFCAEDIESGSAQVSNFTELDFVDGSVDIITAALSFNDTSRAPKKGNFERFEVLYELQRVLKVGGYAILSTTYSLYYKDRTKLRRILQLLGFELVDRFSGSLIAHDQPDTFHIKTLVLKKISSPKESKEKLKGILNQEDLYEGLSMRSDKVVLHDQKDVLTKVDLNGQTYDIALSQMGERAFTTQKNYKQLARDLEATYGTLAKIPDQILWKWGFGRYFTKKTCVLVAQLPDNAGLFTYRKGL